MAKVICPEPGSQMTIHGTSAPIMNALPTHESQIESLQRALVAAQAELATLLQTARDYIVKASNKQMGGGDNPIGFLIASHGAIQTELAAERERAERLVSALSEFRDTVLHQRGALAENGMTNDQVNDVLAELDAAFALCAKEKI